MVAEANGSSTPHDGGGNGGTATQLVVVASDTHTKSGKRGARPRIIFDLSLVRMLGTWGASRSEMAAMLKCSKAVIDSHMDNPEEYGESFRVAYREGFSDTSLKLRYRQIQCAMAGDVKMLTWLGMQLLGQKNVAKQESTNLSRVDNNFTFTIKQGLDGDGHPVTEIKQEPAEAIPVRGGQAFTVAPDGGRDDE